MNRAFTTLSLQSVVAAAIIAAAPLAANAGTAAVDPGADYGQIGAQAFVSTASREQVRAEAIAAARQPSTGYDDHRLAAEPFVSQRTRDQVRAEAVQATRLGLSQGNQDHAS